MPKQTPVIWKDAAAQRKFGVWEPVSGGSPARSLPFLSPGKEDIRKPQTLKIAALLKQFQAGLIPEPKFN